MDKLGLLLERIEQGAIIPKLKIQLDDIDRVLNERDDAPFENKWMHVYREIEALKGGSEDAEPRVRQIREQAYLQAFERWQSPDLSAEISDDFGLIGDAVATGFENEWVNGLLEAYLKFKLPSGSVAERPGRLSEMIT